MHKKQTFKCTQKKLFACTKNKLFACTKNKLFACTKNKPKNAETISNKISNIINKTYTELISVIQGFLKGIA